MQFLHLYGNALTGTLPADLRLPSGLVELDLSDNRLVGTIPTSWDLQSATQLQLLSLSINNLTGALPAALPSGLITLQLAENALSGTLPPGAWLPPALVNCSLQDNALRGSIPADFRLPASLEKLDLCDNRWVCPFWVGRRVCMWVGGWGWGGCDAGPLGQQVG